MANNGLPTFSVPFLDRLSFKTLKAGAEQKTPCQTAAEVGKLGPRFEGLSFAVHETSKGPALMVTIQGQTGVAQTAIVTAKELGCVLEDMNSSAGRVADLLAPDDQAKGNA